MSCGIGEVTERLENELCEREIEFKGFAQPLIYQFRTKSWRVLISLTHLRELVLCMINVVHRLNTNPAVCVQLTISISGVVAQLQLLREKLSLFCSYVFSFTHSFNNSLSYCFSSAKK